MVCHSTCLYLSPFTSHYLHAHIIFHIPPLTAARPAHAGPLTRLITKTLKIHNPHPHPVAFKVKTTAPKQYCVRPNAGRVESGESVEVQGQ
jgi:hypothetical protein